MKVIALDCRDPASPTLLGTYDSPATPEAIVSEGSTVCIAAGNSGVRVVEFSNPVHPEEVAYYETPERAIDLAVRGDTVFVAISSGGFEILKYGSLGIEQGGSRTGVLRRAALYQNCPNPFNPSTTIAYSVPDGGEVRVMLCVYDLRGRLVRTLVNRGQGPGTYSIHWDGRDDRGRWVASGVYLYTIRAGAFTETRKMIVLR